MCNLVLNLLKNAFAVATRSMRSVISWCAWRMAGWLSQISMVSMSSAGMTSDGEDQRSFFQILRCCMGWSAADEPKSLLQEKAGRHRDPCLRVWMQWGQESVSPSPSSSIICLTMASWVCKILPSSSGYCLTTAITSGLPTGLTKVLYNLMKVWSYLLLSCSIAVSKNLRYCTRKYCSEKRYW